MGNKFLVPVVSFLAGLLLWLAVFVLYRPGSWMVERAPWPAAVVALAVGGLIVFASIRCRRAGGPRAGHIVRTGLLLVMAAFTYGKMGIVPAGVLVAAAVVAAALGVAAFRQADEPKGQ